MALDRQGVPDLTPDQQAPGSYQNIQPTAFGEMRRFGVELRNTADYFNEAVANEAFNNYQSEASKLLYGDRGKSTTMGPDGVAAEDLGYFGSKGRVAIDQRPEVERALDDLQTTYAGKLVGKQQEMFNTAAGKYKTQTFGQISNHADTQTSAWYSSVNSATEKNAINTISNSPLDPVLFKSATADLINARTKQAELAGAIPGDDVWTEAMNGAKTTALAAQVTALGTTDPSRALKILEKNREIAGATYDELYGHLKSEADKQDGLAAGAEALSTATETTASAYPYANPNLPIYNQIATDIPGGYSAAGLARLVQIESAGNPTIKNALGYVGLGQFSEATAKEVGLEDRTDPEQSIIAIQNYAIKNGKYLTSVLGRAPTDAELYVAHQQGPGGAAALLKNPNANAVDALAPLYKTREQAIAAVTGNGGNVGMTAAQFVMLWTGKYNKASTGNAVAPVTAAAPDGAPTVDTSNGMQSRPVGGIPNSPDDLVKGPETVAPPVPLRVSTSDALTSAETKAAAIQAILDNPKLSDVAKQHAITFVNQRMQAEAIAEQTNAAARAEQNRVAAEEWTQKILTGKPIDLTAIANDGRLTSEARFAMTNAVQADAEVNASAAAATYGPGYWEAYQQVISDGADPGHISDVTELYKRAGPGGDLSMAGVSKLLGVMGAVRKNPDQTLINQTLQSLINGAKPQITNFREPAFQGDPGAADPHGVELFQSIFVPKVLAAYSKWIDAGKDPWEFLTQENITKLAEGIRSPQELAMLKLFQQAGVTDMSQVQVPAPPEGIENSDGWKMIASRPPILKDGNPWPVENWTKVLGKLASNPSKDAIEQFDLKFGGRVTAADVLALLGIEPFVTAETYEAPAPIEAQ